MAPYKNASSGQIWGDRQAELKITRISLNYLEPYGPISHTRKKIFTSHLKLIVNQAYLGEKVVKNMSGRLFHAGSVQTLTPPTPVR
jgi:hypothetical protein